MVIESELFISIKNRLNNYNSHIIHEFIILCEKELLNHVEKLSDIWEIYRIQYFKFLFGLSIITKQYKLKIMFVY